MSKTGSANILPQNLGAKYFNGYVGSQFVYSQALNIGQLQILRDSTNPGGPPNEGQFSIDWVATAGQTKTIQTSTGLLTSINWGDGTTTFTDGITTSFTHTYINAGTYTVNLNCSSIVAPNTSLTISNQNVIRVNTTKIPSVIKELDLSQNNITSVSFYGTSINKIKLRN